MGNKILRQRLKGPTLAAYYPRRSVTIADIQQEMKRYDLETWNEEEEDRLESLQIAKLRGKGAPKKKRTKDSMYSTYRGHQRMLTKVQQAGKEGRRDDEQTFDRCLCITVIPCMKNIHTAFRDAGISLNHGQAAQSTHPSALFDRPDKGLSDLDYHNLAIKYPCSKLSQSTT